MTRIIFNYHHSFAYNQLFIISELINCFRKSYLYALGYNDITQSMLKHLCLLSFINSLLFSTEYGWNRFFLLLGAILSLFLFLNQKSILSTPIIIARSHFLVYVLQKLIKYIVVLACKQSYTQDIILGYILLLYIKTLQYLAIILSRFYVQEEDVCQDYA